VPLVLVLTVSIVVHKSSPSPLDFIVLTLNQVCGFRFQVFTGSPIHPPSRCSHSPPPSLSPLVGHRTWTPELLFLIPSVVAIPLSPLIFPVAAHSRRKNLVVEEWLLPSRASLPPSTSPSVRRASSCLRPAARPLSTLCTSLSLSSMVVTVPWSKFLRAPWSSPARVSARWCFFPAPNRSSLLPYTPSQLCSAPWPAFDLKLAPAPCFPHGRSFFPSPNLAQFAPAWSSPSPTTHLSHGACPVRPPVTRPLVASSSCPARPPAPTRSSLVSMAVHASSPVVRSSNSDFASHHSLARVPISVVEFCLVGSSLTSPVSSNHRTPSSIMSSLHTGCHRSSSRRVCSNVINSSMVNFASSIPRLRFGSRLHAERVRRLTLCR
jgi:hypothetical protein